MAVPHPNMRRLNSAGDLVSADSSSLDQLNALDGLLCRKERRWACNLGPLEWALPPP